MKLKISPDLQKSKSLKNMAKITLDRLKEWGILKYPTNSLTDYYDIIHKLMESITLSEGIKFKGDGAHKELVDYISDRNKYSEQQRLFLQEPREYRNRISYEGFTITEDYLKNNKQKIQNIIDGLLCENIE